MSGIMYGSTMKNELEEILLSVTQKFGHGKSENWKNGDFLDLSHQIHLETKIVISIATLKRIFGKVTTNQTYFPQKATLQALKDYSDFIPTTVKTLVEPSFETKIAPKKKVSRFWALGIFISIMTIITCIILSKDSREKLQAQLELVSIDGTVPATVYLRYHIPKAGDSFFLDFNDGFPKVPIESGEHQIARFYRYPGMFHVTIKHFDKIISDTLKVLVKTQGWSACASYFGQPYDERFYPITFSTHGRGFGLTSKEVFQQGLDTSKIVVIRLDNYFESDQNADNFEFSAILKRAEYWSVMTCYSVEIFIVGTQGRVAFKIVKTGCSKMAYYTISEKHISGTREYLPWFTYDLSDFKNIFLRNHNKKVDLIIENERIFSETYNKSLGKICGLSFIFNGNGVVKKCRLSSKNGTILESSF